MTTAFESGVQPANHANGRERKFRQKNIIRVNSRYSRADLFRLLFVSIRVHSWLVPLRREGRNDLFKARIAAQRIPKRQ